MFIQVEKMANNQYKIFTDEGVYFQSYSTVCAKIEKGKVTLYKDWDYSNTTLKYLKQFLRTNKTKKEIQEAINNGEYEYSTHKYY